MPSPTSIGVRALLLVTALTSCGLAGCAISDPYGSHSATTTRAVVRLAPDSADPAPERGGTVPAGVGATAAGASEPTPQAALVRYAELYVNWSASDVAARQRQLASISLGQARTQALQAAASAQHDTLLLRSKVTNAGEVVAVAPGQASVAGKWVIVTREQTTGAGDYAGLPPTVHVIYAELAHTRQGWLVSSWLPQN